MKPELAVVSHCPIDRTTTDSPNPLDRPLRKPPASTALCAPASASAAAPPTRTRNHLAAEPSDKVFRALSDASLAVLLGSDDASVRKATALKCVRALPKGRVTKILADYVSTGQDRYYNVVHWLDLGVSAPRDRALPAAEKVLKKEWGRIDT